MLTNNPHALLTPFVRGGVSLPTRKDVSRIRERTQYAFCTGDPTPPKPLVRSRTVEKQIKEVVKYMRPVYFSLDKSDCGEESGLPV